MNFHSHHVSDLRKRFAGLKHEHSEIETTAKADVNNTQPQGIPSPAKPKPPPINYSTRPRDSSGSSVKTDAPVISNRPLPPSKLSRAVDHRGVFRQAIATSCPALSSRAHTVIPHSLTTCKDSGRPIQTNKFYSNLYLGSQKQQIYPLPYTLKFSGRGLDVNHTDEDQLVYGPVANGPDAQYLFAPVGIVSLSVSALEAPDIIELSDPAQFSINIRLRSNTSAGSISFPIVRGSAFITSQYDELTPEIQSGVLIRNVDCIDLPLCRKWRITLEDGKLWCLYACGAQRLEMTLISSAILRAQKRWTGCLQLAKIPSTAPNVERHFDQAAGTFATSIELSGSASTQAQYSFTYSKVGQGQLLNYALPHHVASFDSATRAAILDGRLASQCNGLMTLVFADTWNMTDRLPLAKHLSPGPEPRPDVSEMIRDSLEEESKQDFDGQIRTDSMYFSGKALNKLAQLAVLASKYQDTTYEGLLSTLGRNLMFFVRNQQQFPLVYDFTWGGVVSCQGFTDRGDGSDFGNTWYNDHHYHYGYHVSSAAIYLHLVPNSPDRAEIETWAKTLIRDVASPVTDEYFPAYRSMDWFVGHSWSKGIYESADGKDEESSSEDYHFTYACYLLAVVTKDEALRIRSLVQLAVQRRAIQTYMLFSPDNTTIDSRITRNCVSGIKFENKIDYTTYFGASKEFIHGIHMLPITPITPFFRSKSFVQNEWKQKLEPHIKDSLNMEQGWRGILYANLGLSEGPYGSAWHYFKRKEIVDGGATRSWYLAMIAESGT